MQQEAVTLLESRSGEGSLPEEEAAGEEADTREEEAEAEEAARALLGLPSTAKGTSGVANSAPACLQAERIYALHENGSCIRVVIW